jgi:hypothetical protein
MRSQYLLSEGNSEHNFLKFEWFSKFRSGVTSVNYAECSEWTSTNRMGVNMVQIRELMKTGETLSMP